MTQPGVLHSCFSFSSSPSLLICFSLFYFGLIFSCISLTRPFRPPIVMRSPHLWGLENRVKSDTQETYICHSSFAFAVETNDHRGERVVWAALQAKLTGQAKAGGPFCQSVSQSVDLTGLHRLHRVVGFMRSFAPLSDTLAVVLFLYSFFGIWSAVAVAVAALAAVIKNPSMWARWASAGSGH